MSMTMPDPTAATAGAEPMSFWPWSRQNAQIPQYQLRVVFDSQYIDAGFADACISMRSLTKRPAPMDFKVDLAEKKIPHRTFQKGADRGLDIPDTPRIPYSYATRAVGVTMTIYFSWNAVARFKDDRLTAREVFGNKDQHMKLIDCSFSSVFV